MNEQGSSDAKRVRAILIEPSDNVVTLTEELEGGEVVFWLQGDELHECVARSAAPIYHKIAIAEIPQGEQVIKYATPIGCATQPISPGDHVHSHNLA